MTWGFPRHSVNQRTGKPNKPNPVNNARDDKLLSARGMWRPWFLNPEHRCLIPITAFAEAVGPQGKMTRAWISIADQPIAACAGLWRPSDEWRPEEHTSELQSLMRTSYAVFCLKNKD